MSLTTRRRRSRVQCDAPERLYKRPRRRFVADFFRGCNVLEAELAGQGDGAATYRLAGIAIDVPLGDIETPGRHVALRAENVHLGTFAQRQPCRLSATLLDTSPAPLLDRMELIPFDGYTTEEKLAIAKGYLLPRQLKRNGLKL